MFTSISMTARGFFVSLVLAFCAFVCGATAKAGSESSSLETWQTTSGIQTVLSDDFSRLQPGEQGEQILLEGSTMYLEAGKSLTYPPLCLNADDTNFSSVSFVPDYVSRGFAVEMTSVAAELVVEGFLDRQLVDTLTLSLPPAEGDTIFYGLTFSGLIDEVVLTSTVVSDGVCFLEVYAEHDGDGDGLTTTAGDCDDTTDTTHPGAIETCDSIDNDCNGTIDDSVDGDGDGYVRCHSDCDDENPLVHPNASEICDGVDQDCDQIADDGTECYDDDGDGYPENSGDCDDADSTVVLAQTWCQDADRDGYSTTECVTQCQSPGDNWSWSNPKTDCDDDHAEAHPNGTEACDGLDNDCDGLGDAADGDNHDTGCYDDDGDGYTDAQGDCDDTNPALSPVDADADGYSTCLGDCNDANQTVYPSASETCNKVDDDCDGTVDNGFTDGDGNGVIDCYEVDADEDGVTVEAGDCDDSDPQIYLGADEICNDVDDDCDGQVDGFDPDAVGSDCYDDDGDGYSEDEADCDDEDPTRYPGATEVLDDGIDQDCDGRDEVSGGTETPTESPVTLTPGPEQSPTPVETPVVTDSPEVTATPGDFSPTPSGDDDLSPEVPTISTDFGNGSGCTCSSYGELSGSPISALALMLLAGLRMRRRR